jgi:hypothetical protein
VASSILDHDDFGFIQSKIMNVIGSNKIERDMQISLRNLRKLDCAGKAAERPTFPHPALGSPAAASSSMSDPTLCAESRQEFSLWQAA